MQSALSLPRFFYIHFILFKHGIDEILLNLPVFRFLRFVRIFSFLGLRGFSKKPRSIRIREALEELGPLFVKFGQTLSTRVDIIPEDIIQELLSLTDQVQPFCGQIAAQMIEEALQQPLSNIFKHFDTKPLASASIAQVQAATLHDGTEVIVKVLRPHIRKKIRRDLALLKTMAGLLSFFSKRIRHFKPKAIVAEFASILEDELDLMREAANASVLKRHFQDSELLYVPKIYWEFTSKSTLIMERVYGISPGNIALLKARGFNLSLLSKRCIEIFFVQVFRDSFFHADMHPGNLLVSEASTESPSLIALDFGIMGTLSSRDQRYLAENLLSLINRDYRRVAELHAASGWIPKHISIDAFAAAIRTVAEPLFEQPTKDISFAKLLLRLLQTASRFDINIQPQLTLLQKTLMNVEGLSRHLDPELDVFAVVKPLLQNWIQNQVGPKAFLRKMKTYGPLWMEKLPELPQLLYANLVAIQEPLEKIKNHSKSKSIDSKIMLYFGILLGVALSLILFLARSYYV